MNDLVARNMTYSIQFYCGINETEWNRHPVAPGPLACIAPVYGRTTRTRVDNRVRVPHGTRVIQDSGAFSDGPGHRLSYASALRRQIRHATRYRYAHMITHVASYDLLIDEKWSDGTRRKERWTEAGAWAAVRETVGAARWLNRHRHLIWPGAGLILSAQGVTARQYLECVAQIAPLLQPGDILGLGGWCITGKMPRRILPVFVDTMRLTIPLAGQAGIKRVHLWGVIYPPALAEAAILCRDAGIQLSTDSAGPAVNPVWGEWGYADWRDNTYERAPVETRGLDRARHVKATRDWLAHFPAERYRRPHQMSLFNIEDENALEENDATP